MIRRIDISHKTIFFITGFIALLWALYQIREVIILLFISLILMSALHPLVMNLVRFKIPKGLAIALIYIVIVVIFGGLLSLVVTPLVEQTTNLTQVLPHTLDQLFPGGGIDKSVIQEQLNAFSKNAVTVGFEVFNNFLALVSVAVITFYLLLERERLDDLIGQFFIGREGRVKHIVERIEDKLGSWLRGQLVLSLVIGVSAYIALLLLNVPYALPLAILAGFMEVVPVIGPIISVIPAVLVAYIVSPVLALGVIIAYLIIQQAEAHFVVPQVMKKAVGLNPLIVILTVSIGGKLLGIAGALLAVPITVVIQILIEDILKDETREIIP